MILVNKICSFGRKKRKENTKKRRTNSINGTLRSGIVRRFPKHCSTGERCVIRIYIYLNRRVVFKILEIMHFMTLPTRSLPGISCSNYDPWS